MRRLIVCFFWVLCLMPGFYVMAQADISLATHWYNRANYNPAFITRTDYLYIFSNARRQWTGVAGAPEVINIQASGYIHSLHSAIGLSVVGDKIGVTSSYDPLLTYAYRIADDGKDWSFSMGLSAGVFIRTVNGSLFEAENINDPSILYENQKMNRPDANIGFEFQNTHFIFGISSTHILTVNKPDNLLLDANHRYGYAIYKNNNLQSVYYKIGLQLVNRYNLTVLEGNIFFRFKHPNGLMNGPREVFDLGFTYRTSRQMTLLFGVMVTPDLKLGYAFDQCMIPGYSQNGTHEIMIEYRILCKASATRFRCENKMYWYH
jgi:type IX secretion system PorP/SprF family membrane protein